MAKFNLMHCLPHHVFHGLKGYKEVIESVEWGLSKLGHKVSVLENEFSNSARNIVFGAQVLPVEYMKSLPENSIIYNFEQVRGVPLDEIKREIIFYSQRFEVWEYSEFNLEAWNNIGAKNVKLVPVGYAPILTRIRKPKDQDIDVLIYGLSGQKRVNAFHRLSYAGLTVLFVCGLYGEARDALIARSKVVLNVNVHDFGQIFEIVRVSYLLANRKAVVSTLDANTGIENDVSNAVKFTTLERLVEECSLLIEDDDAREQLEENGFECFVRRDIRNILTDALG